MCLLLLRPSSSHSRHIFTSIKRRKRKKMERLDTTIANRGLVIYQRSFNMSPIGVGVAGVAAISSTVGGGLLWALNETKRELFKILKSVENKTLKTLQDASVTFGDLSKLTKVIRLSSAAVSAATVCMILFSATTAASLRDNQQSFTSRFAAGVGILAAVAAAAVCTIIYFK